MNEKLKNEMIEYIKKNSRTESEVFFEENEIEENELTLDLWRQADEIAEVENELENLPCYHKIGVSLLKVRDGDWMRGGKTQSYLLENLAKCRKQVFTDVFYYDVYTCRMFAEREITRDDKLEILSDLAGRYEDMSDEEINSIIGEA